MGKSKISRCSRSVNVGQMHVGLSGEPLEEEDFFRFLRSQVAANGGCEMDVYTG